MEDCPPEPGLTVADLPEDLWARVLGHLDRHDLGSVRAVSQQARRLVNLQTRRVRLAHTCPSGAPTDLHDRFPAVDELHLVGTTDAVVEAWLGGPRGARQGAASPTLSMLRVLDVSSASLTALGLRHLLQATPRLQRFVATRWVEASGILDLPTISNLSWVELGDGFMDNLSVTDRAMAVIGRCTSLTRLSLQRCVGITDAGLAHLAALPALSHLCLAGTRVTGGGLGQLFGLTHLDIGGCHTLGDAALCSAAPALTRLRVLRLEGSGCTNAGLVALRQLPALHTLLLGPQFEVGDGGLAALAACTALAELSFGNFNITGPPPAGAFPALTSLQLGGTFFNRGVRHAFPLGASLAHAAVSGYDAVTDGTVRCLVGQPSLRTLALSGGYTLTSAGLQALAALPHLHRLSLEACPLVARDAALALLRASPSLQEVVLRRSAGEAPEVLIRAPLPLPLDQPQLGLVLDRGPDSMDSMNVDLRLETQEELAPPIPAV